jgi:multiple sugar transport system permease protein
MSTLSAPVIRARKRGGGLQNRDSLWSALPWIGPVLLLIFGIVLFPAGYMI